MDYITISVTNEKYYIIFDHNISSHFHVALSVYHILVTLTAEVAPITLDVSKELLHFRFSPDTWRSYVSELVTLSNPFNQPAEFKCTNGKRTIPIDLDSY